MTTVRTAVTTSISPNATNLEALEAQIGQAAQHAGRELLLQAAKAIAAQVLEDQPGPARDIVMLNAGAAIYAAGLEPSLVDGVARAREVLRNGKARETLEALVRVSNTV